MPIIIRELTIKASVDNQPHENETPTPQQNNPQNTEKLVEQVVERVLEILQQQKER